MNQSKCQPVNSLWYKMALKSGWKGPQEVASSPQQGQINLLIELEGDRVCWELFSHNFFKEQRQKSINLCCQAVREPFSAYSNHLLNECC